MLCGEISALAVVALHEICLRLRGFSLEQNKRNFCRCELGLARFVFIDGNNENAVHSVGYHIGYDRLFIVRAFV